MIIFFPLFLIDLLLKYVSPNLPYRTLGVLKKLFLDPPQKNFFCRPLKGLLWKSDSKIWSENVFGHCGIAFTFLLFSKKNPEKKQNFQKKFWPLYNNFFEILKKPDDSRHSKLRFKKKELKKIQPRSWNKSLKCLSQITQWFEFVPTLPTLPYLIWNLEFFHSVKSIYDQT